MYSFYYKMVHVDVLIQLYGWRWRWRVEENKLINASFQRERRLSRYTFKIDPFCYLKWIFLGQWRLLMSWWIMFL